MGVVIIPNSWEDWANSDVWSHIITITLKYSSTNVGMGGGNWSSEAAVSYDNILTEGHIKHSPSESYKSIPGVKLQKAVVIP